MILQRKIRSRRPIASKCDIYSFPHDFSGRLCGGDDYHEIAAQHAEDRAAENARWQVEKAQREAMKPAELLFHLPVFSNPIVDPKGD